MAETPTLCATTMAEAGGDGIAPVYSDHPGYSYMRDRDDDGEVCK